MNRKIIHLDLDAFYCAVEELLDPSLKGKPFSVGGMPDGRGVVASCSYAARQYGVRSAMPMKQAIKLCPDLIALPRHGREYGKKSREVMSILQQTTNLIEQISIDEAFLDVTAIDDDAINIAKNLQIRINKETSLPCSLGVATNKLVAKIASDVGKSRVKTNTYPNAIEVVPEGKEREFLAPLPARMLWGIGPKTAEALEQIGLRTIGDIAQWPVEDFIQRFGQHGKDLSTKARGEDTRQVITRRETKSVSQEVTFGKDVDDEKRLLDVIERQSKNIAKSLKRSNLEGSTIKLKLRWPNFETITRQITLPEPTDEFETIYKTALKLFKENWKKGFPIRLLGVGISGFDSQIKQLSLWESASVDYKKIAQIDAALSEVKSKFGDDAIHKGIDSD